MVLVNSDVNVFSQLRGPSLIFYSYWLQHRFERTHQPHACPGMAVAMDAALLDLHALFQERLTLVHDPEPVVAPTILRAVQELFSITDIEQGLTTARGAVMEARREAQAKLQEAMTAALALIAEEAMTNAPVAVPIAIEIPIAIAVAIKYRAHADTGKVHLREFCGNSNRMLPTADEPTVEDRCKNCYGIRA